MTNAEMDALVKRANAAGFQTVPEYAVALEKQLSTALLSFTGRRWICAPCVCAPCGNKHRTSERNG